MKKALKFIFIGILVAFNAMIIFGFVFMIFVINGIPNAIDEIGDKIFEIPNNYKNREKVYEKIIQKLEDENIMPNSWKYAGKDYSWGFEMANYSDKYCFYIDQDIYNEYTHYWLEDKDTTEFPDGYNSGLSQSGEYVFHCINIKEISYESNDEYEDIVMYKDKDYYSVKIYERALYYQSQSWYNSDGSTGAIKNHYDIDYDSLSDEYLFYFDGDELEMKKVERKQ